MPATTYYYRAYVQKGGNTNYSKVAKFTTTDPQPEITMATASPSDICAVKATLNGGINIGNLRDVTENQHYGFIYTRDARLNDPAKLTYEYYQQWQLNHFETEDDLFPIDHIDTDKNMDGRVSCSLDGLIPGCTYYYRTFFSWNDKYFYSPEVKEFTTLGTDAITVGVTSFDDVTSSSAVLSGTFPYSSVGTEEVDCGFLISKKYSNASEFTIENAYDWNTHRYDPRAEIWAIGTKSSKKDYSIEISGLDAETTYYVCGYVFLAEYVEKGKTKTILAYGPVQSFTTPAKGTSGDDNIEIFSEGSYPWEEISEGVWMSGNKGKDNSSSVLYVTVNHKSGQKLSFNYEVSSEKNYDSLKINDGSNTTNFSREEYGTYVSPTFTFTGETVFTITYSKDGGSSSGNDRAKVYDFTLN